jgi:O-antigen ligase
MKGTLRKSYFILLICLVISLPFSLGPIKLNSYLIILLVLNTILLLFFSKNEIQPFFSRILILFVSVYVIHLFGLIKTDNTHEAAFELQKKLSVLLFPLLLFFSPRLSPKEVRMIMRGFVLSCLLTSIVCLINATYHFFAWKDSSVFFYHNLSSAVGMHATYLSMFVCFSIAILLCTYVNERKDFNLRDKIIYSFSIFILVLTVILLGVRTQLIILIIGLTAYFITYFYEKNGLVRSVIAALAIGIFIIGLIFVFPTNRERIKEAFNYNIGDRWGEQQVRFLMWSSAYQLIKTHPLTGVGVGDVQDELQKYYLDHEYTSLTYLENTRYNAHNQFLETAIGLGIPGLLVLLASFFVSLRYAYKHKKIIYFIFILLFFISCMTESMLERQSGVVFYAFFNSFLFLNSIHKASDDSKSGL